MVDGRATYAAHPIGSSTVVTHMLARRNGIYVQGTQSSARASFRPLQLESAVRSGRPTASELEMYRDVTMVAWSRGAT